MPKFSEVFLTTLKVLGALAIVGLVVGAISLVIGGIGSASRSTTATANAPSYTDLRYKEADERPASLPQSKWKTVIAAAMKQGCVINGMTKQEVEATLGKPSTATEMQLSTVGDDWTYVRVDEKHCTRYEGDKCTEHPQDKEIIFFSPGGHVYMGMVGGPCFKEPFYSRYYLPLSLGR